MGDHVCFRVIVRRKSGKPQAVDLQVGVELEDDVGPEEGMLTGTIKSFDIDHGYGFISCLEAKERYNRDVFVHSTQIKDFTVGAHVAFVVRINKQGNPQAWALQKAPDTVAWLAP